MEELSNLIQNFDPIFRNIFDKMEQLIYISDPNNYEILYTNDAVNNLFGERLEGKKCYEIFQDLKSPCSFCTNHILFGEEVTSPHVWEYHNKKINRWYRCIDQAVKWDDKRMVRFEMAVDITDQKQIELELERTKMQYDSILASIKDPILVLSLENEILYANNNALELFGKDIVGKKCHKIIKGIDDACKLCPVPRFLNQEICSYRLQQCVKLPGVEDIHFFDIKISKLEVYDGKSAIIEVLRDVTKQHQLTGQLKNSEADLKQLSTEFETIIDSMPKLVFYKDDKNNFVRVNKYTADAYSLSKKELEGKSLFELYPKEQADAYWKDDLEVINSGKPKINIIEPRNTDKGKAWVSTSKIPFINKEGKIVGIIGVSMDITEQKEAELTISRQAHILEAINIIFKTALTVEMEDELAKKCLEVVENLTGAKFGFFGELNKNGKFDTIAISNPGWDACKMPDTKATLLLKNMELRGIWSTILKDEKSYIFNQPNTHPSSVGVPESHPPISSFLGVPLKQFGKTFGMIGVANKEGGFTKFNQEAIEQLSIAIVETLMRKRAEIELEKHRKHLEYLVNERIKELKCIYNISELIEKQGSSIDHVLKELISIIPAGYQFPEITGVRIIYESEEYKTDNFEKTKWCQESNIVVEKKIVGNIEVCYLEEKPVFDEGPFLNEERDLIKTISDFLGRYIQREIIQTQLINSEKYIREITSNVPGIIFQYEIDTAGKEKFNFLSDGIKKLMELESEAILSDGSAIWEICLKGYLPDLREKIKKSRIELVPWKAEYQIKTPITGTTKWVEGRGIPKRLISGETIWNGWIRDIADQKNSELILKNTMEQLKKSNEELEQFAYVASHDLQEPLRMVSSFTQLLQRRYADKLDKDANEFINFAVDGATRMQSLISDLLIYSRVGTRGNPFKRTDMNVILEDVLLNLKSAIEETRANITNDPLPIIKADESQMIQLMQNLLSNAIKFHGIESPKIYVSAEIKQDKFIFSVKDNGIGIESQYFERIFIIFQRLHKKGEYEGTGIGLSVCKKIVQRHKGEIWLESELGKGTTFYFSIPRNIN